MATKGTSRYECSCGYQASSQQDLDEHCVAMANYDTKNHHQR